jgi:hypothetical protein
MNGPMCAPALSNDLASNLILAGRKDYMRQYLGIIEGGEEIIYANFFCTDHETDWHNEFVFVMDGGDCFFSVKHNPGSGEFFDLSVNGES